MDSYEYKGKRYAIGEIRRVVYADYPTATLVYIHQTGGYNVVVNDRVVDRIERFGVS